MRNVALIIAGGKGTRMKSNIPKQFLKIKGKEIIAYTLECFQNHDKIHDIYIVCLKGFEGDLLKIVKKFKISKFRKMFQAGNSAQKSIYNGIMGISRCNINKNDNIIVHDAIRPITPQSIITDVIDRCNKCGNGVTSLPYTEQLFMSKDGLTTKKYLIRDFLRKVSTPQCYKADLIIKKYKEARAKNIGFGPSSYTNTMMVELGVTLYLAKGSSMNIKLTTKDDLEMFKLYVENGYGR